MPVTLNKAPYIPTEQERPENMPGKPYGKLLLVAFLALGLLLAVFASQTDPPEKNEIIATEAETLDSLSAILARIRRCQALPGDGRRFDSLQRLVFRENLHTNDARYIGPQCVYVIHIDGRVYKYGKAALKDKDADGTPNRINRQLNELKKRLPLSDITHDILFESQKISTREIEEKETWFIQQYVDSQPKTLCREARLPEGNQGHIHKIDFNR